MARTWTFPQRLHLGLIGTVALAVLIAVAAVQAIVSVAHNRQQVASLTEDLIRIERLRADAVDKVAAGRGMLLSGDPGFGEAMRAAREDFLRQLADLRARPPIGFAGDLADRLAQLEQEHEDAFQALAAQSRSPALGRAELARRFDAGLAPRGAALDGALAAASTAVEQRLAWTRSELDSSVARTTRRILAISVGALALALVTALLLSRTLVRLWRAQERMTAHAEAARERYADLVEGLGGVIVWEADPETLQPRFVSRSAQTMLGLDPAAPLAEKRTWHERIPPEERERLARIAREAGPGEQQADHRILDAQGGTHWFHTAIHRAQLPSGPVLRGLSVDITRAHEADEGLRVHAQQQAAVARLGQRALRSEDFDELCAEACRIASWTLAVEAAGVFRRAEGGAGGGEQQQPAEAPLRLCAGTGWLADAVGSGDGASVGADEAGFGEALRSARAVALDAGDPRARIPELFRAHRAASSVAVPIEGTSGAFGVLAIVSRTQRHFSLDDQHFLQSLANVLASAVDRARVEGQLRESEQRFRLLVEGVEDYAIFMLDAGGRVVSWNPGAERVGGYRAEDVLGRPLSLFAPPLDDDGSSGQGGEASTARLLATAARDGKADEEGWRRRKDGSLFWADVTLSALRAPDGGGLVGYAAVIRDITERKRTEDVLRLLVAAGEAFSQSIDFDRTLDVVSRVGLGRFCDACAVMVSDPAGLPYRLATAAADPDLEARLRAALASPRASAREAMERVLRSGAPLLDGAAARGGGDGGAVEVTIEHADASSRPVRSFLGVPLTARARTQGAMLFLSTDPARAAYGPRDVSVGLELARRAGLALDNARLYREAQEAIRARDQFLSVASHELKTPLTSLQLHVQTLLRRAREGEHATVSLARLTPKLEVIERQSERLARLVNNLLDISHITGGALELTVEEVDLSALARAVVERARGDLRRAGCRVDLVLPARLVGLWDRVRLEQVLTNLLSNAMKYGAGQPIEIRLEEDAAGRARFSIRDRGIGIAAEDRARIFERFERAVSERHYGGFGLGLWTVRQIVRALGGEIDVQSEPGQGSTFIMTLPIAAARAVERAPAAHSTEPPPSALH